MPRKPTRPRERPRLISVTRLISLATSGCSPVFCSDVADLVGNLYRFRRDAPMLLRYAGGSVWTRSNMSRRVKRPLKARGDRPKGAPPYRGSQTGRPQVHGVGGKPSARFSPSASRAPKPPPFIAEPAKAAVETPPLPTKVQTVVVTADEN